MQTLIALLVAAAAACAVARPGLTAAPEPLPVQEQEARHHAYAPDPPGPERDQLLDYILPRILISPYLTNFDVDDRIRTLYLPRMGELTKEINRLQMQDEEETLNPYNENIDNEDNDPEEVYVDNFKIPFFIDRSIPIFDGEMPCGEEEQLEPEVTSDGPEEEKRNALIPIANNKNGSSEAQKQFAFKPTDKEFFQEPNVKEIKIYDGLEIHQEGEPIAAMLIEPPRQTRQNPINLSKQKHLLEPDLAKLKTGLSHEDGEKPKQHQIHSLESPTDPADSIYGVALVAAVGAALAMAILGFAFGWYTLSKKAKAAADVDYPAYGVTGPAVDTSGDRKLAHSAHMYHYQHQKQQIIAMERNGMDQQRPNSVSDPESEEDNEEGDYTVYECPGFATTGDMEVKNPLFSEEPTPVTPGKCEVVKPQPKD